MPLTLSNTNGTGNFTLANNNNSGNLSFSISSTIVTDSLSLFLDASDPASYPGSGTTWFDLASPQQNITLVGSPTYTLTSPSYFTFNGTNQYGTGTGQVLNSTSYTKSIWFRLNTLAADNNLVSSDTGGHYVFFAGGNKLKAGNSNWAGFPNNLNSVTSFSTNTWYNATITFNTTDGMTLYVNGAFDVLYTAVKTAFTGNGSTNIGCFAAAGNLLNGRIAKVYCYTKSLTAAEVLQNYNADKVKFGL